MSAQNSFYRWQDGDLLIDVLVQPRSSQDKIIGEHDSCLKIQITAPPVDGKANSYLCKYLAKVFKVAKSRVSILKGETGRHKVVKIISPQEIPLLFTP